MSHKYQHANGAHTVTATETELTLDGRVIWQGWAMFPKVSRHGRVAWKAHDGGGAMLYDGMQVVDLFMLTTGNWPAAWRDDGTLYVQAVSSGQWVTIAPDGRRGHVDQSVELAGLLPAAEGIHHVTADGKVVLHNDPSVAHGWLNVQGQRIETWRMDTDRQGNRVCLAAAGGPKGCVLFVPMAGDPMWWIAPNDLPHPPFVSDGRVAISGDNPPPVGEPVAANGWQPYRPPTDVPPAIPPGRDVPTLERELADVTAARDRALRRLETLDAELRTATARAEALTTAMRGLMDDVEVAALVGRALGRLPWYLHATAASPVRRAVNDELTLRKLGKEQRDGI